MLLNKPTDDLAAWGIDEKKNSEKSFHLVKGHWGNTYKTLINDILGLKIHTIYNLGEAIDELCLLLEGKADPLAEDYCPYF